VEPLAGDDPRQVGVYRLHSRLGAGGMGRVYLGYSPGGRAVAVKVVHPELALDPEFMERFRREVQAAEAVSGAYTAPVVAAGPDDRPPWLATVFVTGPSLSDLVGRAGPLPQAAVWRLAGGLAEALQAIHAKGLVHRDLKPANILIATDGPRVIDFGISRALQGTAMTGTRTALGTPAFMSPEQAQGHEVGPPSDVFSLGSVVAFAATGVAPFDGGEIFAIAYRLVSAEPDLSGLPPGLRQLVARCLAKDPAARPTLTQVMDAVVAGSAAFPAAAPGKFWPEPVAVLLADSPGPPTPPPGAMPPFTPRPGLPQPGMARPGTPHPVGAPYTMTPGRTPPGVPPYGTPPGMTAGGMTPVPPVRPAPRRGGGRTWLIVVGLASVGAVIAGTVLALVLTSGSSSSSQPGQNPPPGGASAAVSGGSSPAGPLPSVVSAAVCTVPADGCAQSGGSQYMEAKPAKIMVSGDGSGYVDGLSWSSWGTPRATATGTLRVDDCVPNCAQGTYTGYPATVTLAGLKEYQTGVSGYSTIVVQSPAANLTYTYTKDTVP
jgi:serine/threonine protein kinase